MLMSADTLKGRVVDAETGDHLPNVELQYFIIPINDYYAFSHKTQTDSLGVFHITVKSMSKVQYELQYFGYEPFKQTLNVAGGKDTIDLEKVMEELAEEIGIESILVEGGGRTIASLFKARMVDRYSVFVGGLVIGGANAPTPCDGDGWVAENGIKLELKDFEVLGNGALLTFEPRYE